MHTVITDECTGCDLCVEPCPVDCIDMLPVAETIADWKWSIPAKPGQMIATDRRGEVNPVGSERGCSMSRTWVTPGGVHPPENKHQSVTQTDWPIANAGKADYSSEPTYWCSRPPPVWRSVSQVLKGRDHCRRQQGMVSIPMHAPSSGTISAIEHRPIAHASGMLAPCIEITTDGADSLD